MKNLPVITSIRQRLIEELLLTVENINDSGLSRLNERAVFLSESHSRYPTASAEITSLAEWRNCIDTKAQ